MAPRFFLAGASSTLFWNKQRRAVASAAMVKDYGPATPPLLAAITSMESK
jgi:hypothetical protein